MEIDVTNGAIRLHDTALAVELGPALPALQMTVAGHVHEWRPARLSAADESWTAKHVSTGVSIELEVASVDGGQVSVRARVRNGGSEEVALGRLDLATTSGLRVGADSRRWRIYRNGYQSWAGTWTIGVDESDIDVPTRVGRAGVTDGRHRAATGVGHVRSDSFGAIVDPVAGAALAVGFTTLGDAFGFVEVDAPHGQVRTASVWVDLDDTPLAAGATTAWFEVRFAAASDGTAALRHVIDAAGDAMEALGRGRAHPAGWCSWYYYFTKVTEADVVTNLEVLARDGRDGPLFGCEYVMVDDGHQTAIGDWLSTNDKFPSGMRSLAERIVDAGFDAGIWWAPFIVSSRSKVAAEHPEWLVRNERGRPILGLVNPGWGLVPMWVLDTTHPGALDHIRRVAEVIGREWGYQIQKIDFLFAAAHPGVRHDRTATRAQALRRGLEAVRAGCGPEGFVLGCGSPMGPAVGLVDAMRIGSDVTPSWTTLIGRTVGRNRHALATAHALLNTMTRSMLDGSWFLNDPDCLMVRDTDTKLTEAEVHTMCTVFGMTNGMVVLSDRLDRLPSDRQALVARTRALTGGVATVVDLFEHALPGQIVTRHDDRIDVAYVNLTNAPRSGAVDLDRLGIDREVDAASLAASGLREYWTGDSVAVRGTTIDLGTVAAHSARVVQLPRR